MSTHPYQQRLNQRFAKSGMGDFSDLEVLELLLSLGGLSEQSLKAAANLIARFGDLGSVVDASLQELSDVAQLPRQRVLVIPAIRDAAVRLLQRQVEEKQVIDAEESLSNYWRLRIGRLTDEVFHVAYLDARHRLMRDGVERLAAGTTDRTIVYPRSVMRSALRRNAVAIVMAHNHPNGRVSPTEQDKLLTRAMVHASDAVGIRILDHLIVSNEQVFSFRRAGLL